MMISKKPPSILLLVLCLLVACGASQREKTIRASFVGLNAARDGFVKWDEKHQAQIVEKATSLEDGKAKLVEYRLERAKVVESFETAYKLISTALLLEDERSLSQAISAVKLIIKVVDDFSKLM